MTPSSTGVPAPVLQWATHIATERDMNATAKTDLYRCCGCGMAAPGNVKPCDCATMVGGRDKEDGRREYIVLMSRKAARRLELSGLIKTRLLGIHPEDQDLVLEDGDWAEIVASLEGDRP